MQLPAPKGEITLENVVVIPPSGTVPSLKGISMKIEKGDVVGIIGPSAAGKSSLARVMLGLWPLTNGVARIDKADISQWDIVLNIRNFANGNLHQEYITKFQQK